MSLEHELVASAPEDPDPPQTATAAAVAQPAAPQEDQSPRAGAQCVERPGVALEERRETQAYLSEGGSIKALKALDRLLDEKGEIFQRIADDAQGPASGKKDTHKPREAVRDASQMPAEVLAQIRHFRPGITDAEIQRFRECYEHSCRLMDTHDQNPARQLDGMQIDHTFPDKASGKDVGRLQSVLCCNLPAWGIP